MISVIIPTLNEEKLIAAVLRQFTSDILKKFDLEIIISDGGSTDATRDIVENICKENQIEIMVLKHNEARRQTIAEGRNIGSNHAHGELFVFLNADTRFQNAELFFAELIRTMQDQSVLAATCSVQIFPEEEKGIDRLFHYCHNGYCRLLNFIGEGMGRGECHIIRREVFHSVRGFNAAMAAGEDYDLFRRIRKTGKIAFLQNIILYESPRRFRKYGYFHIVWGWTKNALAVAVKKKSSSEIWEAVR